MKKQSSIKPGQKRLTQFFTIKPSQEDQRCQEVKNLTGVIKESETEKKDEKTLSTKIQKNENNTLSKVIQQQSTVLLSPDKLSVQCSPKKLTQKSLFDFSPTKENILVREDTSSTTSFGKDKITLNGKKLSLKLTPQKKQPRRSPKKPTQSSVLKFSPTKHIEINSIREKKIAEESDTPFINNEFGLKTNTDVNTVSKKRKYNESPLKDKQNGEPTSTISSLENIDLGTQSTFTDKSGMWTDEGDFVNLCEDLIVISPKKIEVKKRKCSVTDSSPLFKCSLNFEEPKTPQRSKALLEQDLSSYFLKDFKIDDKRSLSFDKLKRYQVVEASRCGEDISLTLKNLSDDCRGTCIVKSPWNEFAISEKDIVSVRGMKKDDVWIIDWNGLLVINPDRLISGTTIVGSVYCMRKTILSHIFKEPGGTKDCMVVGSFVHELFQEVLKERLNSLVKIEDVYKKMINNRDFMLKLFHGNMNFEETISQIHSYVDSIHKFMQHFVFGEPEQKQSQNWPGHIVAAEDIEENIWSPVLGIKGKVDATVEVKINKKTKVMPLELKTGKVSFSIEHRGQVILYCMLLQQLERNVDSGLLLYLNSGVEMKEIKCEERETRDLTLLRNGLSHWLMKMSKVEPNDVIKPPVFPPPINRRSCSSCPFLVPCSAALRENEFQNLSEGHHLKEYGPEATKHLSQSHIDFIFHWLGLLLLEKSSSTCSLSDIWSVDSEIREKSGKCLAQMKIDNCLKEKDGGFKAILSKIDGSLLETEFTVGQLIVVSTEGHFAYALGVIESLSPISLTLIIDKPIKTDKPIFLDAYEGDATFTILTNSLSCLLENNSHAAVLRELIIDLKIPTFSSKLSSKIKKVGEDIFQRLNREQVRAVLQAIASENYILIKGMPGTGKTTTMAALIELLTRLKKRVLVTSFTHSAIDNILINLVGKVKMLRLGPEHRIHQKIKPFSEQNFIKTLKDVTPGSIEEVFSSREVVGVTCFGCKHPWIERQFFDVCLIDEATQVPLPGILKPISVAQKFVLVGDPKQLPPLVLNKEAKEFGLGKSLFERLERPAVTSPLTLQYRMNRVITCLANELTYNGMLQCANKDVEEASLSLHQGLDESWPYWVKESLSADIDKSIIILNVKSEVSEVGENKTEAAVVKRITEALLKARVSEEAVGVIATYSRQVALLRSLTNENIEVNTVDQYQGRDKEIIIYSTTRSSVSAEKNDILSDWNRLTVAVTRAKKKLIIVGDLNILNQYNNFKKLISAVPLGNVIQVLSPGT